MFMSESPRELLQTAQHAWEDVLTIERFRELRVAQHIREHDGVAVVPGHAPQRAHVRDQLHVTPNSCLSRRLRRHIGPCLVQKRPKS